MKTTMVNMPTKAAASACNSGLSMQERTQHARADSACQERPQHARAAGGGTHGSTRRLSVCRLSPHATGVRLMPDLAGLVALCAVCAWGGVPRVCVWGVPREHVVCPMLGGGVVVHTSFSQVLQIGDVVRSSKSSEFW